jgi:8-oxo-dGTP pyrophosphatase MutT (NUDIX family)
MTTLNEIQKALAGRIPQVAVPNGRQAAVAMLLKATPAAPEMLFIERARRLGDPWSGDIGFPGGKIEPEDTGPKEAAEREVREEIGVSLAEACYLGRLDDITGHRLPVTVSCFVYGLHREPLITFSEEVVASFWVPLPVLLDPGRRLLTPIRAGQESRLFPALRLLPPGRTVLWGLTYRMVMQFLEHLGHDVGETGRWAEL